MVEVAAERLEASFNVSSIDRQLGRYREVGRFLEGPLREISL